MTEVWTCQSCGCMFPSIAFDEDMRRCTRCVELAQAQARIAELVAVVARVQNADVRMVAWEADDDLVTVNGKPVGATLSRRFRGSIQDVWTSIRDELLAPDAALAAKEKDHG